MYRWTIFVKVSLRVILHFLVSHAEVSSARFPARWQNVVPTCVRYALLLTQLQQRDRHRHTPYQTIHVLHHGSWQRCINKHFFSFGVDSPDNPYADVYFVLTWCCYYRGDRTRTSVDAHQSRNNSKEAIYPVLEDQIWFQPLAIRRLLSRSHTKLLCYRSPRSGRATTARRLAELRQSEKRKTFYNYKNPKAFEFLLTFLEKGILTHMAQLRWCWMTWSRSTV